MIDCPCTSGKKYSSCCEPFVTGAHNAPTAEALMRARYSAYVVGNIDFVATTHDPNGPDDFDPEAATKWSKSSEWMGLEVLSTEAGMESDNEGTVEFVATFKNSGAEHKHHELSYFKKTDGKWFYTDGKTVQKPVVRDEPKTGRNDPCPCGSGKKFKKCHG